MKLLENLPFSIDQGLASRASLGLIVLASDYTIEAEWNSIFNRLPGVSLYHSRIQNDDEITPETLSAMEPRITDCAAALTPGTPLDVVAYGCTSATTTLGEERVFDNIRKAKPEARCTTPITAAFAAFSAFRAKRIAVLTPYTASVNRIVADYITRHGFEVPVFGSFNEPLDSVVCRISPDSIASGVEALRHQAEVDAVFVSCTSVRLVEQCEALEQTIGLPLTSSNHAMAWHACRLAGIDDNITGLGSLFKLPLNE